MAANEKETKKKKGKENYPSKVTLNLYYKEDKTTGPATVALYTIFIVVVLLAALKFGVYDMYTEMKDLEVRVEEQQLYSETLLVALKDYNKVKAEHSRYTQSYLKEDEILKDRIELLNILEATVFKKGDIESARIMEDSIFVSFTGLNLEQTALLVLQLEAYDCVKKVDVQTASLSVNDNSGYALRSTTMIIEIDNTVEGGAK